MRLKPLSAALSMALGLSLACSVLASAPAWADTPTPPADAPVAALAPVADAPPALGAAYFMPLPALQPASPMRLAAYGLWGSAGAMGLGGTTLALLANKNYNTYRRRYSLSPRETHMLRADADPAAARRLKSRINTQKALSITGFVLAGGSAIAGTTLFFLAPEWQKRHEIRFGLAPVPGGAALALQGRWL